MSTLARAVYTIVNDSLPTGVLVCDYRTAPLHRNKLDGGCL